MLSIAPRSAFAVAIFALPLAFTVADAQDIKPLVITGELTKKDPFDKECKASHYKVHDLELKAGAIYLIDLRSVDFDTFLRLEDAAGKKISANDDISETDPSSRLGFVPRKSGKYRAVVTTLDDGQTGRYRLQVGTLKKAGEPTVVAGKITETSPTAKTGHSYEVHKADFKAGEFWLIDLMSKDIDLALEAYTPNRKLMRAADESGGERSNARLVLGFPEAGEYRLQALALAVGTKGAYTLRLQRLERTAALQVTREEQAWEEAVKLNRHGWKLLDSGRHQEALGPLGAAVEMFQELYPKATHPNGNFYLAASLSDLAYLYKLQGSYAKAEPLYKRVLDIRRQTLGEKHRDVARSMNHLASLYRSQRDYAKAEALYRQALEIHRQVLGGKHRDFARTLSSLAYLYESQGDYAKAEPLFIQALQIYRQVLGEKHPDLAWALDDLAGLYRSQAEYAKAEPLLKQALEIRRQVLGEKHPDFTSSLQSLAYLYEAQGDYAKAEPLYKHALEICRQVRGEKHPDLAWNLERLARLYELQGDYAQAEPLYRQALRIQRQVHGAKHRDVAVILHSLAYLYQSQGDYAKAEPLHKEALEICRQVLGEKHTEFVNGLNGLASLYVAQRDYAKAEPLYKRALEINRQVHGEKHRQFASSLNSLAYLYRLQAEYAKAEPLFKQALEIRRQVLGEKHPDVAWSLNNLALVYEAQREYARAESLCKRALEIYRHVHGDKHRDVAGSLNQLASVYKSQGDYAKAEPLLKQTLEINQQVLGEKHPYVARSLRTLASLYGSQGEYAKGEPLARQAVVIMRQHLEASALVQSERQQIAHRARNDFFWNDYLDTTAKLPEATATAYDLALSWKGSVTVRQRLTRIARTGMAKDPQAQELFHQLDQVSRLLSTWSSLPLGKLPKGIDLPKKLAELSAEREEVEAKLSARTEGYRKLKQSEKLTAAELQKQLPEGTVLVDFFEYGSKLAAFVVTRDRIERIELQEIKPIAEAVERFRQTLKRPTPVTGEDDPALVLRQKLLDPLDRHLAGAKLLLISPVGPLTSLPFAALPGKKEGKYLIEETPLAILPVPQMLPELLAKRDPAGADAPPSLLALGDVDFDGPLVVLAQKTAEPEGWKRRRAGEALNWNRLPGTRGEILAIEDVFRKAVPKGKLTVLRDGQPTEAAVRNLAPQHEYLHFATHGFFAPKEVKSALKAGDPKRVFEGDSAPRFIGHHPGLLSGIVLAGANRPREDDDGVLTALEVSELDLTRVELAVLSACETGLGEVAGGEGVLGLQRAFQIAGARTTITSLWKVDDKATRNLMERFYDNYWKKNMGTLEALREAQLAMLRGQLARGLGLDQGRDDARLPPYFWAAFALSGDWR